jgi:signal recognition particle subunit SRP72
LLIFAFGLQAKKAKKKRKPRLPKGYDPTQPNGGLPPPDPERWLPKWQRSDAKKKQRRRRDRQVRLGQGAGGVLGSPTWQCIAAYLVL